MSPERAQGESDIDGRTDVYSVGALLYHLLTGQTPFSAPGMATVILKHLYEDPPDAHAVNPNVPANVAHVIQRAMAKQRGERHASCAELAAELELVHAGRTPTQRIVRQPPAPIRSALPLVARDAEILIPAPIQRQRAVRESSRRTPAPGASRRRMIRRMAAYGVSVLAGVALLGLVLLAMRGSQPAAAPARQPEQSARK
jgi:serine/threonine protein kinase